MIVENDLWLTKTTYSWKHIIMGSIFLMAYP